MAKKRTTARSLIIKLRPRFETWGVRLVAILTAGMGLVNLFSAVIPALKTRLALLDHAIPLDVRHGSRLASALAGFALLLLANSLWWLKRLGWLMTLIILFVSIITHLVKGLDYEEASLAGGLILLLLLLRPNFHADSDPPSIKQGLWTLVQAFLFTLVYGVAGLYLLDAHYKINFGLVDAVKQTVTMFVSFSNPGIQYVTTFGKYFLDSIYIVAASTIGYALLMLIRPVLLRQPASSLEHARTREIIEKYGHTALARPALFDDKSYYFSPGGSVIAYAARGGGAVALTDPIGPVEDAANAITGFREICSRKDWQPAFASVLPDFLPLYKQAGFETLCIANEAIVELKDFTLEGSANKKLRNAVTKISHLGFRAEVHLPPLEHGLVARLKEISDEWLTMKSGGELRFAMGWFDEEYLREGPVMTVYDASGDLTAFANLVTEYQNNEITIDLMRHHRQLENGTMEFLFASLLEWARQQGYATFSLGQSPLSNVGQKPDDPRAEQFLHYIFENFNRFYNFKGLHNFKEKFNPRWEPRYFIYPGVSSLPTLLTSFMRINSGDDFLMRYFKK
jgi:phosphatidylglycerol lysyltransferase